MATPDPFGRAALDAGNVGNLAGWLGHREDVPARVELVGKRVHEIEGAPVDSGAPPLHLDRHERPVAEQQEDVGFADVLAGGVPEGTRVKRLDGFGRSWTSLRAGRVDSCATTASEPLPTHG